MAFKNSLSASLPCFKIASGQYPITLKPRCKTNLRDVFRARMDLFSRVEIEARGWNDPDSSQASTHAHGEPAASENQPCWSWADGFLCCSLTKAPPHQPGKSMNYKAKEELFLKGNH